MEDQGQLIKLPSQHERTERNNPQRSQQKQSGRRLTPVEIEKWRKVLRTTYVSFALRSCAPKCLKKMPGKPGDDQKS